MVKAYAEDLGQLLEEGDLMKRKHFLRIFVKHVDIAKNEVTVRCTLRVRTYGPKHPAGVSGYGKAWWR